MPKDRSELNVIRAELSDSETVTDYFQSIVSEFVNEFVLMEKLKGYTYIVSYEDHKIKQERRL